MGEVLMVSSLTKCSRRNVSLPIELVSEPTHRSPDKVSFQCRENLHETLVYQDELSLCGKSLVSCSFMH
jgi:hypothetical protein